MRDDGIDIYLPCEVLSVKVLVGPDERMSTLEQLCLRAVLGPEQALHEALCCRDLSEVSLRIGVTKVYETFAPLPGGHFE